MQFGSDWTLLGLLLAFFIQGGCQHADSESDAGTNDSSSLIDVPPCVSAVLQWKEIWDIRQEALGLEGPTPDVNLVAVWGTGPQDIYVVGNNGLILHFDGTRWTQMESPSSENLQGIWGYTLQDENGAILKIDVFAVGEGGTILRYNGTEWSLQRVINDPDPSLPDPTPVEDNLHAVWGIAPPGPNPDQHPTVMAVGAAGLIVSYQGDENVFLEMRERVVFQDRISYQRFSPERLGGVIGFSREDFVAVGNNGTILEYRGSGWERRVLTGFTTHLNGVWGPQANEVFAVGLDGTVVKRSGGNWQIVDLGIGPKILRSFWGFTQNKCGEIPDGGTEPPNASWAILVGWDGTILLSRDGLVCSLDDITKNRLEAIWGTSPRPESARTIPDAGIECDPVEVIITGVNGTLIRLSNPKGW